MAKQRLHPDITWTGPYKWQDIDTEGLESPGAFVALAEIVPGREWHAEFERRTFCCSVVRDDIVRLRLLTEAPIVASGALVPRPASGDGEGGLGAYAVEDSEQIVIRTGKLALHIGKREFSFSLDDAMGKCLLSSRSVQLADAAQGAKARLAFTLDAEDHFFGFGGRTVPPQHRGKTKDLFAVKVAHERGDYGGLPMPFFMNPRGYGLLLDNPWPHVYFDMGWEQKEEWSFYTPDGPLDLYLIAAPSFPEILDGYYHLTGAPVLPDKAYFGLWYSCAMHVSAEGWMEIAERLRREGWPADAIVLDLYWRGGRLAMQDESGEGCNLGWDTKQFGGGPWLVDKLHELNFKVGLHINTRLYSEPVLSEGLRRGALRRAPEKQVVPVFGDKELEDWNWSFFAPRVQEGADFWWTDNGERVDGLVAGDLPSRNLFGQQWNEFLFRNMAAMGHGDRPVLARGAWVGAHRSTLPWPGDTSAGVDRIKEDLWFVMNMAMSGVPFTTVDLGGFRVKDEVSAPDIMARDENMIRRVIHGFLLSATIRIHAGGKPEYTKLPWAASELAQPLFRHFLELRYRLLPYIYSASVEAVQNAVPLFRPLAFDYPADPAALAADDVLLLGPSLLIAPVTEEGREEREVYLPAGRWFDYWTGEAHEGGRRVIAEAPLYGKNGLPIFVKENAVLLYRPLSQSSQAQDEPVILLDLYPCGDGQGWTCQLWEGPGRASRIEGKTEGGRLHVSLENNTEQSRDYLIRLFNGNGTWLPVTEAAAGEIVSVIGPSGQTEARWRVTVPAGQVKVYDNHLE
ncbi:MAG: glycosyl hydrolase, family 31 [Paenibacillaceae bacterium]|jgi:alpha-D-xyloside xylohydrolase|nr:glycosyl hydrolase, family 31 [Paenibacillaceae bacterium]